MKYNRFAFSDLSVASSGNVILGWTWKFGDSIVSSSENPHLSFKNSGNTVVSLIVADSNQCTDSSAKTITILPQIKAVFAVNDSNQCFEGNSFAFKDQSILPSGTNFWSWNFGDNQKSITQNPFHSYSNPGHYKVVLIVSNSDGCKDTINKIVIVRPKMTPKFGVNALKQCLKGNNFAILDSSAVSSGSILSWSWNFGDGKSSQDTNPVHQYQNPGIYHIILTVKSDQGCSDSTRLTVTVNQTPAPFIFGDSVICAKLSANYLSTNDPGSKYQWIITGGKINSASDTTNTISANWPVSDTGQLVLVETNIYGCVDSDSISVVVNPLPVAKFGASNHNSVCPGNALNFIDSSSSATQYFWKFGDGNNGTTANPSHTYAVSGKYTAYEVVTNSFGCLDTTKRTITVNPLPNAYWSADSVQNANIIFIPKDTSLPSGSYAWDFGDGTKATGHKLHHIFPGNKAYNIKLIVTSAAGCTNEFDSTVVVTVSGFESAKNVSANLNLNIYPNPFHKSTNIEYELTATSRVKIGLYDMNGKEITTVADEQEASGKHKFEMDGNKLGLTPGTYILKVYVNDAFTTKDIIKL